MANKPLRAYLLEIEGLIESGQLEETVSHCRYILQSFPKHVDTYRLLGKVFLEAKQFSNAADILQRVLSAVPDDFVSHVGMSIIREDEGNLDAAIWHMERAFESKPANKAIQDELRRLFGRRDGVEPPKIRLTRGALARMYAKGNLYDQAIAELRGALSEDPQRSDLQLLLAQMNYLSGNRVEAVEASSNLLKKFPYCLTANRILALILPQTERSEDAKVYQQRALALDPYLMKAGADALTSLDVPDNAVMIETLEIKPGQPTEALTEQPAWAASLGIKLDQTEEEELPDWLTADLTIPSYEGEQTAPFVDEEMETSVDTGENEEALIPTWMKEAGWQPSSDEAGVEPPGEKIGEFPEGEDEIEKADIPDWLKDIATVEEMEEESTVEAISEDALPPWLEETPPGPTDSIISWLGEREEAGEPAETESMDVVEEEIEIPTWLKGLDQEEESIVESSVEAGVPSLEEFESTEIQTAETEALPEWLTEAAAPAEAESIQTEDLVEPETTETIEESVELLEEMPGEIVEESASIPEWLSEGEPEGLSVSAPEELIEVEMEAPEKPEIEIPEEEIEIPDWLKNLDEEIESEPLFEEAGGEQSEIPAWLQELGQKSEEIELNESLEAASASFDEPEELPTPELLEEKELTTDQGVEIDQEMQDSALAWLESLAAKQGASEEELITRPEERLESPPEWILEEEISAGEGTVATPEEDVSGAEAIPEEELPDWLKEIEIEETDTEVEISPPGEVAETSELPAWLRELSPVESEGMEPSEGGTTEEEVLLIDEDAGLAWLESLAQRQGAAEEELITPPEDRTTEPPAWVGEEIAEIEKPGEISEELPQDFYEEVPASDELKAWMADIQEQEVPVVEETSIPPDSTYEPDMMVDLNSGSLSELENIPGVGFVLAQNIVVYRDEHGPFKDLDDLKQVPGVDDFNFEFIQDRLSIEPHIAVAPEQAPVSIPAGIENDQLLRARNAVDAGDYDDAFQTYDQIIKQSQNLNEVISLLENEASQKPDNIVLWQSLGDAYMKNDQFQKALEAYTKAEKLL